MVEIGLILIFIFQNKLKIISKYSDFKNKRFYNFDD